MVLWRRTSTTNQTRVWKVPEGWPPTGSSKTASATDPGLFHTQNYFKELLSIFFFFFFWKLGTEPRALHLLYYWDKSPTPNFLDFKTEFMLLKLVSTGYAVKDDLDLDPHAVSHRTSTEIEGCATTPGMVVWIGPAPTDSCLNPWT